MILASLAADAAPGITFRNYLRNESNPDIDQLQLWDEDGDSYQLLMASTSAGESELATELQALEVIAPHQDQLSLDVPKLVGQTRDSDGARAVLLTLIGGEKPDLAKFAPGEFSKSLGEAIARLHNMNPSILRDSGLVELDAETILRQKVAEIDAIAQTGRVPAALLSRWEAATEEVGLFRFHGAVVHGNLTQETLRVSGQSVTGLAGWSSLRIGDPADDLRWLTGGALRTTLQDTTLNYRANRSQADENIGQRAQLYSELELGSWLLHCLESEDAKEIAIAENMISELREQLDSGNLRSLRAASFAGIAYQASDTQAPVVAASADKIVNSEVADKAQAEPSEVLAIEEPLGEEPKSEDELF
ncbi:MAG: hypothetical protein P8M68_00485 [Aquiluna sp.]|nr:hypothetical protein [Aquiluna sp.]